MIATIVIIILLIVLLAIARREYMRRVRHIDADTDKQFAELTKTISQNHLQMWLYNVNQGTFSWFNEEQQRFVEVEPSSFARHYTPTIYQRINQTLQGFIRGDLTEKTLRLGITLKEGNKRYYTLRLNTLQRNPKGNASLIAAVQTDITEEHLREQRDKELRLRLDSVRSALDAFDDINTRQQADDDRERQLIAEKKQLKHELTDYMNKIAYVIKMGGMRIASYSPVTHMLTVFAETDRVQLEITASRALHFVDESSLKDAQRLINGMDRRLKVPFDGQIKTVIRHRESTTLHLQLNFIPVTDEKGEVTSYFGMMLDIGSLKSMEKSLAAETVRARQLETSKNAFMHNMSFEIRTPLNTVVGFADLFQEEHTPEDEAVFSRLIRDNATQLLQLVNGILMLSRIDAGMIEQNRHTVDFTRVFEGYCQAGWGGYERDGVEYSVDIPFEQLVIEDLDINNLGTVITQLCANGGMKTEKGYVHAQCDIMGDRLIVSIESTGPGIPKEHCEHLFERFGTSMNTGTALALPVCYELMTLMGGDIHVDSDPGRSTRVWVTLPCRPTTITRKTKGGQA